MKSQVFLESGVIKRSSAILAQYPEEFETLRPSTRKDKFDLGVFDSIVPNGWFYLVQVFENTLGKSNFMEFNRMKESLLRVLECIPLAACGTSGGRISTGDGAWICEARTNLEFQNFKTGMAFEPLPDEFWFHSVVRASKKEAPLFSVKMNRFKCGAVALVVFCHHYLTDAAGLSALLDMWGRLSRGKELASIPVDSRHLFRNVDPDSQPQHLQVDLGMKKVFVRFIIPLVKLKATQKLLAPSGHVSLDDILTAAVWRAKARTLSSEQTTTMYRVFDLRRDLEPPLPPTAFGNFVETKVFGPYLPDHIADMPLDQICQMLHLTSEQLKKDVQVIQAQNQFTSPIPLASKINPYTDINASNHSRCYTSVDFDHCPAIFTKAGIFLEGLFVTSPQYKGSLISELCINEKQARVLVHDNELQELGFKVFQLGSLKPDARLVSYL